MPGSLGSRNGAKPELPDLPLIIDAEYDTALAASPSLRSLTEKQRRFAIGLSFQPKPDFGRAAKAAGYEASSKENFWRIGWALGHHPVVIAAQIEMARAKLGSAARLAGDTLIDLLNSEDETIKLRASSEILSRVGLSGTQHIHVEQETTVKHEVRFSEEDKAAFRKRCERLGIALKNEPLLPAPSAEEQLIDALFEEVNQ